MGEETDSAVVAPKRPSFRRGRLIAKILVFWVVGFGIPQCLLEFHDIKHIRDGVPRNLSPDLLVLIAIAWWALNMYMTGYLLWGSMFDVFKSPSRNRRAIGRVIAGSLLLVLVYVMLALAIFRT